MSAGSDDAAVQAAGDTEWAVIELEGGPQDRARRSQVPLVLPLRLISRTGWDSREDQQVLGGQAQGLRIVANRGDHRLLVERQLRQGTRPSIVRSVHTGSIADQH